MSSDDGITAFGIGMILLLMALVGFVVGDKLTSNNWQQKCEKHGMVMSGGKVYECKVKEKRK